MIVKDKINEVWVESKLLLSQQMLAKDNIYRCWNPKSFLYRRSKRKGKESPAAFTGNYIEKEIENKGVKAR